MSSPAAAAESTQQVSSLDSLLASKEMILVAGSGGVGKTTVAAALGARAATNHKARVLVLTIDPARRLADALGLGEMGNQAIEVPLKGAARGARRPRGELWAAMLDTKAGWDELIHRHAPDAQVRTAVLDNPLYQNITRRFAHSHDYLAMEQLHDLHASGDYDLVIVDTPPSRHALDILDAPSHMIEFFGSRLLRWLTVPYRSRLFSTATKPFYQVADRVLGSRFLQDVADFFLLFQQMEKGFVAHAREVEAMLSDRRSSFVVVTTLEAAPTHEAGYLAAELVERSLPLGAVVANRVLPTSLTTTAAYDSALALAEAADAPETIETIATALDSPPPTVAAVLEEIAARFHDVALVAACEAERRTELSVRAPLLLDAPSLDDEVNDVAGLLTLASHLQG